MDRKKRRISVWRLTDRFKRIVAAALLTLVLAVVPLPARAQNWVLIIKDNQADTPVNQVNGIAGGTATLFATLFNYTGTPVSDGGTGDPAPATPLDFAGFGWTLLPGQFDLESLFTPDPRIPGWPQVAGSADGSTPGSSGVVLLGTFDLAGLAPGFYEQDFTVGAFATDPESTVPFAELQGTLRLNVTSAVPEAGSLALLLFGGSLAGFCILGTARRGQGQVTKTDKCVQSRRRIHDQ